MFGALQLRLVNLPKSLEDVICGPWGCGPKLMDLVAYQTFLILLMLGLTHLALRFINSSGTTLRPLQLGKLLLAIGVFLLVGIIARELVQQGTTHGRHFVQRILYLIAISVDAPVLPFLVSGAFAIRASRSHTVDVPSPIEDVNPT